MRSKRITYNGIKFDSEMECAYYVYLLGLKEKGMVRSITLQPHKQLIPSFKKYGKTRQRMIYSPDFYVEYSDGRKEYVDVKGHSTQASDIRRKLFDYYYPNDTLVWVSASKKYSSTGWINYDELQKKRREARNDKRKKGEIR